MNKIIPAIVLLTFFTVSSANVSGTFGFARAYTDHSTFSSNNHFTVI